MKYFVLTLFATSILHFFNSVFAQQNTLSAGGEATSSTGTVSYSVGEVSYINITNISATITEGVQQPYEIYRLTIS